MCSHFYLVFFPFDKIFMSCTRKKTGSVGCYGYISTMRVTLVIRDVKLKGDGANAGKPRVGK